MALPEVDNRIRSRNTKDGIRRALKEGHYPYGMPPKGYSKDNSAVKTPLLVPNEGAPLIGEAFELFSTGLYKATCSRPDRKAKARYGRFKAD